MGSTQESDGWAILGCFLEPVHSDELGVGHGRPLGLQKQVAEILIAATRVDQHANVPVDCLNHPKASCSPTVVQNAVQVLAQHRCEFLKTRASAANAVDPSTFPDTGPWSLRS